MPSSKTKKGLKVIKKLRQSDTVSEVNETLPEIREVSSNGMSPSAFGKIIGVAIVILLLVFAYKNKSSLMGQVVAGTVDSKPIFRSELNSRMSEKYGKQVLDEIVNERILADQLKKNGIVITEKDISDEMAKLIAQYGGQEAFDSAIKQFGLTPEKAKESIKQSLGFKKLVEKNYKIEIKDEAIKKYFDDNKASFTGKKLEDVKEDIKTSLYQQEVYAKSQEWFTGIRKDVKVNTYIK